MSKQSLVEGDEGCTRPRGHRPKPGPPLTELQRKLMNMLDSLTPVSARDLWLSFMGSIQPREVQGELEELQRARYVLQEPEGYSVTDRGLQALQKANKGKDTL